MLRIGIISFWHVHTPGYARDITSWEETQITAVWDEQPARGQEWADKLNAAFVADYDAFLAREDVDAVLCGAPTTMHAALLAKAAAAGKHIFTEKLLTPGVAEGEDLCRTIRESGVTFTVSLPCKGNPESLYIKGLIDSGALGKVTAARFRRSHGGVCDHWLPDYWFDTAMTGGGALMDLGAHPVYILAWLFGVPTRLTALMNNPMGTSSDENAIALAEFPEGVLGTMETGFLTNGVPDLLEVYGTGGAVFMRGGELKQNLACEGEGLRLVTREEMPEAKPSPLRQFVDACLTRSPAPEGLGLEDALLMTKIVEASYRADASGATQVI